MCRNSLSAHIAIIDDQGYIVQVNNAWRAFGEQNGLLDGNHGIGMNYLDICDAAAGPDAIEAKQIADAIRQILAGSKKEMYGEYPCHSPEENRWFVVRITRFHDGDRNWVILAHENITDRKLIEESLREEQEKAQNYLDIADVMMLALDQEGMVTLINQKGCEILGYRVDEVIGKNWINTFVPVAVREGLQQAFKQLISNGDKLLGYYENGVLTSDGEVRLIAWHNSVMRDAQGEIIGTLSSGEDITERKRAEEEIRRHAQETSALLETSLALTNLELEATLQTIGNSANTLFLADGCRIFLMEPDGETLRCVLALEENIAAFSSLSIKLGQGVTGAVAASGKAEIVNEMQDDPRALQIPETPEEQEAIMFAPLKERDRTIGILSVRRVGGKQPFHRAELELLEAFASMAASAVSNARLFEETQRRLVELRASEVRFRQLADNIQEAFWMTDVENDREIYMSSGCRRDLGTIHPEPDV